MELSDFQNPVASVHCDLDPITRVDKLVGLDLDTVHRNSPGRAGSGSLCTGLKDTCSLEPLVDTNLELAIHLEAHSRRRRFDEGRELTIDFLPSHLLSWDSLTTVSTELSFATDVAPHFRSCQPEQ